MFTIESVSQSMSRRGRVWLFPHLDLPRHAAGGNLEKPAFVYEKPAESELDPELFLVKLPRRRAGEELCLRRFLEGSRVTFQEEVRWGRRIAQFGRHCDSGNECP